MKSPSFLLFSGMHIESIFNFSLGKFCQAYYLMLPDVWRVLLSNSDHIPWRQTVLLCDSEREYVWSFVARCGQTVSSGMTSVLVFQKKNMVTFRNYSISTVVFTEASIITLFSYPLFLACSFLSSCECRILPVKATCNQAFLILTPSFASGFLFLSGCGKVTAAHDPLQ